MGPALTCYCGHTTKQARCIETDYATKGFSCTDTCDEILGCGKHRCEQVCHSGVCKPCELEEVQSCYCGRHERTARCGSGKQVQLRGHIGHYSCTDKCDA
jgi:transcriptional repressor NF-X1